MTDEPKPPLLTFLATLNVEVGKPIDVGPTPGGHRRIVPIEGGSVFGPKMQGRVLPAGADFQFLWTPELSELDARYALETNDGEVIYVHNRALRYGTAEHIARLNAGEDVDPSLIYFRCVPTFSTASKKLDWLNHLVTIGTGRRRPRTVEIEVFIVN